VVLGILWIPIMPLIADGGLYKYLQSVQGYLAPPITAVFLLGLFFKRINAKGATAGLIVGFIVGMFKLIIQGMSGAGIFNEGSIFEYIGQYNFLYASGWLILISIVVIVGVSMYTSPPPAEKIKGLTYATVVPDQRKENRESWNKWDVIATLVVLGLVAGMYLYFSFWLK
jgi:SSS family solute:Na+ symporter